MQLSRPDIAPASASSTVATAAGGDESIATAPAGHGSRAPFNGARLGWLLLALGSVGVASAAILLVEKIRVLQDPLYVPSCSINPVLSCGSIMTSDQAEAFGIPNPVIGLVGFAVVATIGAALVAGATLARWCWISLLVASTAGVAFVHWLAFQSLYRIGALCPYCLVVWAVAIATFWYTLLFVTASDRAGNTPGAQLCRRISAYHGVALTAWYLFIAGLIAVRFWDYWSTLA